VTEAEAMDRKTAEALLRPWLGDAVLPDLPLPHLVTVRLDADAPASAVSLSRALAQAGLDATSTTTACGAARSSGRRP
jgi:cell division transport system permease protein